MITQHYWCYLYCDSPIRSYVVQSAARRIVAITPDPSKRRLYTYDQALALSRANPSWRIGAAANGPKKG